MAHWKTPASVDLVICACRSCRSSFRTHPVPIWPRGILEEHLNTALDVSRRALLRPSTRTNVEYIQVAESNEGDVEGIAVEVTTEKRHQLQGMKMLKRMATHEEGGKMSVFRRWDASLAGRTPAKLAARTWCEDKQLLHEIAERSHASEVAEIQYHSGFCRSTAHLEVDTERAMWGTASNLHW